MSELASAMPTAGGIYYWASKLGGAGWGWFTGWFNLIGLVAVVASVDYVCADFLQNLLGLYNLHFIFNFTSTNVHYNAHVVFALFALILLVHGADQRLLEPPRLAVQRHLGLVARDRRRGDRRDPDRRPEPPRELLVRVRAPINNSGFSHGMYWFYVLPLGFLLTMYTITGYDASAHVSEETHGAAESAPKGVWRSVFYSAVIGWIVLLALTFAAIQNADGRDSVAAYRRCRSSTALSSAAAKAVILISTIGQLFCGMACVTSGSRMTFAFSRDGAIPGHKLWRRLGKNRTPTWAVLFVAVFAFIVTIPAYFPNTPATRSRSSRSRRSR